MFLKAAKEIAQRTCHDTGALVIRIALGLFFCFHGAQKLFGAFDGVGLGAYTRLLESLQVPYTEYISVAIAGIEFVCGILLVLGLYARTASLLLSAPLLAAAFFIYHKASGILIGDSLYPLDLCYLVAGLGVALLGMSLIGPGRYSLTTFMAAKKAITPARMASPETILG